MCLYPRLIKNPKYKPTKKNGGRWPVANDPRVLTIPIGCGECMECRKQKAREWQVRLLEDVKTNRNGIFVTLTFSNKSIRQLCKDKRCQGITGYDLDNMIATIAVRKFTERWRKHFKKPPRHWLITELGHEGTENIHLHGFIWTNETKQTIRNTWKYGWCWIGKEKQDGSLENYVTERTINYCVKYIYKRDLDHKYYKAKILSSKYIGANYLNTYNAKTNKFDGETTNEAYITRTGHKISLPKYYRNKIYNEEEREKLWTIKLDKEVRYVNGIEISIKESEDEYYKILHQQQEINRKLGYGSIETDWTRKQYEEDRRRALLSKRVRVELEEALGITPKQLEEWEIPF